MDEPTRLHLYTVHSVAGVVIETLHLGEVHGGPVFGDVFIEAVDREGGSIRFKGDPAAWNVGDRLTVGPIEKVEFPGPRS